MTVAKSAEVTVILDNFLLENSLDLDMNTFIPQISLVAGWKNWYRNGTRLVVSRTLINNKN